jgi:hypothetical protein
MRAMAALIAVTAALAAAPGSGQELDDEEFASELLHSDLPLYSFEWEDFWPRGFVDGDSWGCMSRVRFGDWQFTPNPADEAGDIHWYRFDNYGVFHCAANLYSADERSELESGKFDRGFFVRMGTSKLGSEMWEIWAFQQGLVPGSDYMLLARSSAEGAVESFRVLQRRCPTGHAREGKGLDVWRTNYCAINSREELLTLARKMLRLPPLGTLTLISTPDESEAQPGAENESDQP